MTEITTEKLQAKRGSERWVNLVANYSVYLFTALINHNHNHQFYWSCHTTTNKTFQGCYNKCIN